MPGRAHVSSFIARPEDEGVPLDELVAARLPGVSRRRARVLIEVGGIFVEGVSAGAGSVVRSGQLVEALHGALDWAGRSGLPAEATCPAHRILFEDDDVCVVDKPAGVLTEPSGGGAGGSIAELLARRSGGSRVWVVQRLDAPTSGVLVLAKTEQANRVLAARLQRREVERVYIAVVRGVFPEEVSTLAVPLRGRRAVTHVEVAERFGDLATRVTCTLETGRTHQIRLHCSRAGHPVMGDPRHGQRTAWDPPRMALHATRLGFVHPRTGAPLAFETPIPPDLSGWIDRIAAMAREIAAHRSRPVRGTIARDE